MLGVGVWHPKIFWDWWNLRTDDLEVIKKLKKNVPLKQKLHFNHLNHLKSLKSSNYLNHLFYPPGYPGPGTVGQVLDMS